MRRATRVLSWVAAIVLLTSVPVWVRTQGLSPSAETLYADASAKESAVRKVLAAPKPPITVLKAVRTVALDYESVVRRYPSSPYCDDALWRAALLSSDAFRLFGDAHEQQTATKLLQTLATQYASSKLARQSTALIAELSVLPARASVDFEPTPAAATATPQTLTLTPPSPARPPTPSRAEAALPAPTSAALTRTPAPAPAPAPIKSSVVASRTAMNQVATIKDIRRVALPDVVRVIIEVDREVSFNDQRLANPNRVFLDLSGTVTSKDLRDQTIKFSGDSDPVREIRLGRHPNNITRIVLDTEATSSYSVYSLYNPYRLVIDCLRQTPKPAPMEVAAPRVVEPPPEAPPAEKPIVAALLVTPQPKRLDAVVRPSIENLLVMRRMEPFARVTPGLLPTSAGLISDALREPAPEPPPVSPLTPAVAATLPTAPAPTIAAPSRMLAGGFSLARQLGMSVSRIVIDPGHGGHDPGAKGGGSTEADLVLDVALRLEKLFQNSTDVEVILTRRSDAYVTLQERTAIANRETADLFLSIHANASNVSKARGVETYFLNFANNLTAAATAARENAASGQAMGELPDVVKTIALNNKLEESKDFATYVQREMVARLGGSGNARDLAVKQAPFQVLIGAAMPSILTEVAFLSNSQEARLVKQSAHRQKIAEALFSAVRKYQASLAHVSTVAQKP